VGAAVVALIGLGELPSFAAAKSFVRVSATFTPNGQNTAVYDALFAQYQQLYRSLSALYKKANGERFTKEA
jgi:sugar (pentulose or hexulose) kinase